MRSRHFIRGALTRPPLYGRHRRLYPISHADSDDQIIDQNGDDTEIDIEGTQSTQSTDDIDGDIDDQSDDGDDSGQGDDEVGDDDEGESPIDPAIESPQFTLAPQPQKLHRPLPGLIRADRELTWRHFDSWYEFVTCVADDSLNRWQQRGSHEHGASWSGTDTFDEAVDMALGRGWPEGRQLMHDALALITPRPEPYRALVADVAGAWPMIPLYVAGDPGCMIDDGSDLRIAKPIIRIDYSNTAIASVPATALMLRGAAVLSVANSLEQRGISVELRVVSLDQNARGNSGNFAYSFIFKRAGEMLDIDRAAFAIANPATMRRFGFALLEQHQEHERDYSGNYGRATGFRIPGDRTDTIFIPGPTGRETPESAKAAVERALTDAMPTLEGIAA